jgi:DNA-directed RNA polymerase subunit M/transcription elongation factor TFIIS
MLKEYATVIRKYERSIPLPHKPFYNDDEYNVLRRAKLIILSDCLGKYSEFSSLSYEKKIEMLWQIEQGCVAEATRKANEYNIQCMWDNIQYTNIYHSICYNIIAILDDDDGLPSLVTKITSDKIDLGKMSNMTCRELCPEKYEDLTNHINKRTNTKQNLKYSELYYCYKCKHNQSTVEKRCNRSLDEGVNLTITCLWCGNSRNG